MLDDLMRQRQVNGVVWDREPEEVVPEKLKFISAKLDVPSLPKVSRDFVNWVANYNMASHGSVLRMMMSVPAALEPPKALMGYSLNSNPPPYRSTAARERVLAVLREGPPLPGPELARKAGTLGGRRAPTRLRGGLAVRNAAGRPQD